MSKIYVLVKTEMVTRQTLYFRLINYKLYKLYIKGLRGEMDITTVFGTVVEGSNPPEGTS